MKKHIYNKVYGAAMLATLLIAAAACTNEMPLADNGQAPDNAKPEAGTLTTVTVSQDAGAQTRLNYSDEGSTMKVTWERGDVIYIGKKPEPKNQDVTETLADAGFKRFVCETAYGKRAIFKAEQGQALTGITPDTKLFAFYANEKNTRIEHYVSYGTEYINCYCYFNVEGHSPQNFVPQRQLYNDNPDHVANHDFMYTYVTVTQQDGIPHLSFKHASSLLKFTLKLPAEAMNKQMTKFEFAANYLPNYTSFSFGTFGLGGDSAGKVITLHLGQESSDGVNCESKDGIPTLVVYLVFGDYMMANKEVTLKVTDSEGNTYSAKMTSNKIVANHFYTGTFTLTQDAVQ